MPSTFSWHSKNYVNTSGRDSPRKPREGYVELRQASCAMLACMEAVWAYGAKSGPCWAILGPSWAYVGPIRAHVEPCWAHLGPTLAQVGPMLAHVELSWERCWGHVWAIYVETIVRCHFSRPGPPWSSKPRKNRCFSTSPRWNSLPPRGPKHRKKTKLLTPQAKYTVNYRDFSWPGVVQGCVGGGSASGPAAPITFGYTTEGLRQGHGLASWPAPGFKGLRLTAGRRPSNDVWLYGVGRLGRDSPRKPREGYVKNWGRHNAQCLPVWKQSGPMLSAGCAHVGPSRAHVEPSGLGPSWAYVGPSWAHVELCWAHLGPMSGLCWAHPCWPLCWGAHVGPMLAQVEPPRELCWGHVWAIYFETILRSPFFPPRASSWSPKQRKDRRFFNIAKMKSLAAEGPETPKKMMFLNTASKIHRKLQGLQIGVNTGMGRRQGWQPL